MHVIKPISEIEKENPYLMKVMKRYAVGYEICDYVVVTKPPHYPKDTVYGIFVLDKIAIKGNKTCIIEQDYLVLENGRTAVYYSGLRKGVRETKEFKHINAFKSKYSYNGTFYGHVINGKWELDHHYTNWNDERLPGEDYFRNNLKEKVQNIVY